MEEYTLILDKPISRELLASACAEKTNDEKIPCSGIIQEDGDRVSGTIAFTHSNHVNDRGWSGDFTTDEGESFYASSNKWEDDHCKVINLFG